MLITADYFSKKRLKMWEGRKRALFCLRQHAKQPEPSAYCRRIFENRLSRFGALKLTVCLRGLIFIGAFSCGMPHWSLAETWISGFLGSRDMGAFPPCSTDTPTCPPSLECLGDHQNCDVSTNAHGDSLRSEGPAGDLELPTEVGGP